MVKSLKAGKAATICRSFCPCAWGDGGGDAEIYFEISFSIALTNTNPATSLAPDAMKLSIATLKGLGATIITMPLATLTSIQSKSGTADLTRNFSCDCTLRKGCDQKCD
jgi:hypothetical protein